MSDDNEMEKTGTGSGGGGNVTAKSLIAQASAEAQKGPRESFKAWVKGKQVEVAELLRRVNLIETEIKQAANDFDKGIWIAPTKNQS